MTIKVETTLLIDMNALSPSRREEDGVCPDRGRVMVQLSDFEPPACEWAL
jgi:hypothetical protein